MEHYDRILNYIATEEEISQRKLAKLTDLSLGQLNLILHKLVSKGLVKIERLNPRSLRYILTPEGIARNTRRTYNYIMNAVKHVIVLKNQLELIFDRYGSMGYMVYLDGFGDEISHIVKQVAEEGNYKHLVWLDERAVIRTDEGWQEKDGAKGGIGTALVEGYGRAQVQSNGKAQEEGIKSGMGTAPGIGNKAIVVVWSSDKEEKYRESGIECINLLSRINVDEP